MKYVEWASVRGTAKGTDTLENFNKWSTKPGIKGTYKAVRIFENKPPEAVIATPPTPPEAKPLKKFGETPTE